jgi:hypothetical protein
MALGSEMTYRPLLRTHLAAGRLAGDLERAIDLIEDDTAGN